MPAEPLVSIVIVSYNAPEYLRRCLESVQARTRIPHEVQVIDNASQEETRTYLRSLDTVRVTLNEENRLWCAGCNQGIRAAHPAARYVLLLNPDVEVLRDDWLERMVEIVESAPRVGMAGTKLQYRPVGPLYGFLDGQCLLISRTLLGEVGGLDEERFPWSGAPQLLAAQAFRRGWGFRLVHPSERLLVHHGHKSRGDFKGELPRHGRTLASIMREEGIEPLPVPRWQVRLGSLFTEWRNRRLHFYAPPRPGITPAPFREATPRPEPAR
jgi:GT2 family glycosyltransferase